MSSRRLHTSVTFLLAALLLVVGIDAVTYANTGDSLILGKANKASKTTKIKNTGNGAALALKTKSSAPPLVVSSATKVTNLNADQVDGRDSTALEPSITVYRITPAGNTLVDNVRYSMNIAPGRYMVTWRFTGSGSGVGYCWVAPNSELNVFNYNNLVPATTNGGFQAVSAAGEITIPAANDFVFECEANNVSLQAPIVVTAQALSVTNNGTTGPAARPATRPTTP